MNILHIKLSDGERLTSMVHTVAKILSFEVHTFIEQKFLDPGLNGTENPALVLSLWVDVYVGEHYMEMIET